MHNVEAYAIYSRHAERKRQTMRQASAERRTNTSGNGHIRVSADRDRGRVRQRYLRASKAELVDRLLTAEQAYADMENRWLRTADDLLVWIMLVDRLIAAPRTLESSRKEAPFLSLLRTGLDGPAVIGTKQNAKLAISEALRTSTGEEALESSASPLTLSPYPATLPPLRIERAS